LGQNAILLYIPKRLQNRRIYVENLCFRDNFFNTWLQLNK
jgi:hypothetical protein